MKKRNKSGGKIVTRNQPVLVMWTRFNNERTPKRARQLLYDRRENHVGCTVSAPCSLGQVVTTICEKAQHTVPIDVLSLQLGAPVLSRGKTIFGSAWDAIDKIACNYPNMQWGISEHGLTMDIVAPTPLPQDFDQIAGKLLFEMRQKFPEQSRFSRDQYLEITPQLENFRLPDLLPKARRKELAEWNQKNAKVVIQTFSRAIAAKQPKWLGREAMRRLYRAHDKFKQRQSLR
jgi:hypothetical protein